MKIDQEDKTRKGKQNNDIEESVDCSVGNNGHDCDAAASRNTKRHGE